MTHQVTIPAGKTQVQMPNGFAYDAGAVVTLTDEQFATLSATSTPGYWRDEAVVISDGVNSGVQTISIPVVMADLANATYATLDPGLEGSIVDVRFIPDQPVTTAAKRCTLTPKINGAALTDNGGVMRLNSANCGVSGKAVIGDRIATAATLTSDDVITIVGSSTATFIEGTGTIVITVAPDAGVVAPNVDFIGNGLAVIRLNVELADIADGDVQVFTPGVVGTILHTRAIVDVAATTAAKASTLNLEIGATNLTGGTIALTSANCTPIGAVVNNTAAPSADNVLAATSVVTLEASSTTAFIEGSIVVEILVVLS